MLQSPQVTGLARRTEPSDSNVRMRTVDLSVHFEDRSALEGVNLEFRVSEMTSLVGPNGAGKSTLLKTLAAILPPTHGCVLLDGEELHHPNHKIAYIPQRSDVDWRFPISVLDVAAMGRALHAPRLLPVPARDRQDALAALAEVGMRRYAAVQIGALSGGQQQRVFIARALLQDAEVYLMDEPFTGVDAPTQALVVDILGKLCASGKTIIYATHDLAMAGRSADRCVLLNRTVIDAGQPAAVITAANLQATFGGAAILPLDLQTPV
ncbi:MAG: metal ABC transporter ATP-binding protein [Thermomicrobiales bacterium]